MILTPVERIAKVAAIIDPETVVAAAPDQVSCDLEGEAVILNLKTGTYYGLNEVGAAIWTLLQEPRPVRAIRDALLTEYEVEPERCERDLLALLAQMAEEGIVTVQGQGDPREGTVD